MTVYGRRSNPATQYNLTDRLSQIKTMSLQNLTNQTIALAGIAQACSLVRQLATTGNADSAAMEASIASLLKIDADSVLDVYGGLIGVRHGLEQLEKQLGGKILSSPEQARYAAQLVYLQKQLA